MRIVVIAPNERQYREFVRRERERLDSSEYHRIPEGPEPLQYRRITEYHQLQGYYGEIIIVNSRQCELSQFELEHNTRITIKEVEL